MLSRAIGWVRRVVDVVFPRGAIVLSVLSLGYFAMGLVRNRVFANTFGAGAELDAYNAAFRIPEIALDVLVAGGPDRAVRPDLHEPAARRTRTAANTFGRTVLTGAVGVMAVASTLLAIGGALAGRRVRGLRSGDAGALRRAAADQLPGPGPVRGVVRPRRGPRGEPTIRVLRARADPLHRRDRPRDGPVRRAASGSTPRPGVRSPAPRRTWSSGRSARPGPRSGSDRPSRSGRRRSASSSG